MSLLTSLLLSASIATSPTDTIPSNLSCPDEWQANQQYQAGEQVRLDGKIYTARWTSLNESPLPYTGEWQSWEYRNEDCVDHQRIAISDTAKNEMDQVLTTIEHASLYRYNHDWRSLKAEAWHRVGAAQTNQQLWPVIQWLITDRLQDHHGGVVPPSNKEYQQLLPEGRLLPGNQVGYIKLPEFASEDPLVMMAYADQGHQLFRQNDGPDTCGWIVDLRGNWGGNSIPMLAALSPLFGDGRMAGVIDADGTSQWLVLDNQTLVVDPQVYPVAFNPYTLKKPQPPIAVLTSGDTASGAEFVLIAIKGRGNTHHIGQPTYGTSTMAQPFALSDGASMLLSVANMLDINGQIYGDPMEPDHLTNEQTDNAVSVAKEWLTTHTNCKATL